MADLLTILGAISAAVTLTETSIEQGNTLDRVLTEYIDDVQHAKKGAKRLRAEIQKINEKLKTGRSDLDKAREYAESLTGSKHPSQVNWSTDYLAELNQAENVISSCNNAFDGLTKFLGLSSEREGAADGDSSTTRKKPRYKRLKWPSEKKKAEEQITKFGQLVEELDDLIQSSRRRVDECSPDWGVPEPFPGGQVGGFQARRGDW
ncbi:hypothetical protein NLI96_g8686 [Meripilus lineatus]|uniref:Uncharacterized protein n=1 Tax=Meripilus lineatus TaxID=2056292 RepID=A0AAD5YDR3_9APHY|nr:hypothetical protein NLI96_g8686 [Physisporinus lineatus]